MISLFGASTPLQNRCSRARCEHLAAWAILWRNPKIHSEERRKTWLACQDHRDYLEQFLAARSFPLDVVPFDESEPQ